jgi:hypothetical protein
MTKLSEMFSGADASGANPLKTVYLRDEPSMLLCFTPDAESANLHFEGDESVRRYLVCPGPGCPICFLGAVPIKHGLLPVFNVESCAVEVLQVSDKRGPNALGPLMTRVLADPDIASKVVFVTRSKSNVFAVTTQPLAETADHGEAAIRAFLEAQQNGLKLITAYWRPTATELANVERVRRKLEVKPGWQPPSTDKPTTPF